MAKPTGRGFVRTLRQWEESIAGHTGKFIDKITIPHVLELASLGALVYTYYNWEKESWGIELPVGHALKVALPQAFIDYMAFKSGTEVGVGFAVSHLTLRGIIEVIENPASLMNKEFKEKLKEVRQRLREKGFIR